MCHPNLQAAGTITVLNTGQGIPVQMHKGEGVYVPELIFGHLLTSSNYNDDEKKVGLRQGVRYDSLVNFRRFYFAYSSFASLDLLQRQSVRRKLHNMSSFACLQQPHHTRQNYVHV